MNDRLPPVGGPLRVSDPPSQVSGPLAPMTDRVLQVSNLSVHFAARRAWYRAAPPSVRAVDDVSFSIAPREIVGLVGESGSGKSTLARAILQLITATSGSVRFDGEELIGLDARALKNARRRMQVIFQDPYASLNPRMTAGQSIAEGLLLQGVSSPRERAATVADLLVQVGLPAEAADRYPHEFSGGQRQRIGIARALAVQPTLILADEPVSALDMSIQAQILNLLLDQQERRGLALLFIGHDLSVIRHFCDRIMVLLPRPYRRAWTDRSRLRRPTPPLHPRAHRRRAGHPSRTTQEPHSTRRRSAQLNRVRRLRFHRALRVRNRCLPRGVPALRGVAADHFSACIRDDLPGR